MKKEREREVININYPRRPGFILKAHQIRQEIAATFGLTAELVEQTGESFEVVLKDTIIYQNLTADNSDIDQKEIIRSMRAFKTPLPERRTKVTRPDDIDDPDHLQWMNSVCSGE